MKRDRQGPEHQTTLGWLTSWMGSAAPANATISDEERRKLNESIGFDGARKTVVYARDVRFALQFAYFADIFASQYVRFRVGANLSGVQLLLRRKGKSQTSDVVRLLSLFCTILTFCIGFPRHQRRWRECVDSPLVSCGQRLP